MDIWFEGCNCIAIVGMGCRLPGDIKSLPQFWELLSSGRSTQSEVPENRFNIKNWYHPDSKRFGSIASTGGYFLSQDDSYCQFDPSFFGIHPLEASSIDPQQRKLLEVVFETFESAGVTLQDVSGSRTACYVGAFTHDFKTLNMRDTEDYAPYSSTGSDMTVLSNRINYAFNLKGPSLTVDTACSSSLYALHLACQGLRAGDFDAAIVAGTNIIMDVRHQVVATKLGILSPTSTCHTFDECADGFGRAEGITAIYIKRVADAVRQGDPVRAVIRATAVNTNGKGPGITHPGIAGQAEVIRQAYAKAGLDFNDTAYVECHGTGTPVGDPIEVEAVGTCFAAGRSREAPMLLSAVKSQIGHTEGASGIAGLQKAVLSLEQCMIPATIGITRINPALNLRGGKLRIVCALEQWPTHLRYGRVSVNSFGYGGANAHTIIDATQSFFSFYVQKSIPSLYVSRKLPGKEEPRLAVHNNHTNEMESNLLLVTSAHSTRTLQKNISALAEAACQYQRSDLAYTLGLKRTHFPHRGFCVMTSSSISTSTSEWKTGTKLPNPPTIAFVFTGQGAQWPRMGIELVDSYHVVRKTFAKLQECLNAIPEKPEWTLHQALAAEAEHSLMMTDVVVSVTLCTAIQVALVDLLHSWDIKPTAVVGHSSGEAAAAYCAGYLTLSETIITSYYRALSLKRNPQPGLMMAVGLGRAQAEQYVLGQDNLYLACHNSPQSVTIAGLPSDVEHLEKKLQALGIFARIVKSSGFANHSPLVQRAGDYFLKTFTESVPDSDGLAARKSSIPMYSCITGAKISCTVVDAKYWSQNIAAPVLFDEALQSLLKTETSVDLLIELGPHSALAGPIRQVKALLGGRQASVGYLPTIVRGSKGDIDLFKMAGALFNLGYPLDLKQVNKANLSLQNASRPKHIVDLPTYQWTYQQDVNIAEQRIGNAIRFRKHPRHDLLGTYEPASTPDSMLWRNRLSLSEVPWIKDHLIGTSILFPASGYVAVAIEAMIQYSIDKGSNLSAYELRKIKIVRPLVLVEGISVETVFEMTTSSTEEEGLKDFKFKFSSVSSGGRWVQYATGECAIVLKDEEDTDPTKGSSRATALSPARSYDMYSHFTKVGLKYGPCFQTLQDLKLLGNRTAQAKIDLQPTRNVMKFESRYQVHPATLDGCLQAAFAANASLDRSAKATRAFLPKEILYLRVHSTLASLSNDKAEVLSKVRLQRPHAIDASFQLIGAGGACLIDGVVRLVAADGISASQAATEVLPEPYQRLVSAVDIDCLTGPLGTDELLDMAKGLCTTEQANMTRFASSDTDARSETLLNRRDSIRISLESPNITPGDPSSYLGAALCALIQLIAFKRPHLRYMEIGTNAHFIQPILQGLNMQFRYPSCIKTTFLRREASILEKTKSELASIPNVDVVCSDLTDEAVDVIIVTGIDGGLQELKDFLVKHKQYHLPAGLLILACPNILRSLSIVEVETLLRKAGYPGIKLHTKEMSILLVQNEEVEIDCTGLEAYEEHWIVYQQKTQWTSRFLALASNCGLTVRTMHLSEIDKFPQGARAISLLEAEHPLVLNTTGEQLASLQKLLAAASSVDWVYGNRPEFCLFPGMARSLKAEIPLLSIRCIQVDSDSMSKGVDRMISLMQQLLFSQAGMNMEENIIIRDDKVMITRYVLDEAENSMDMARTRGITEQRLFNNKLRLDTPSIRQVDSFRFIDDEINNSNLKKGQVRIQSLIYSMNAQNVATLHAQNQGRWFSNECFGKVVEVSEGACRRVGDHVLHLGGTTIGGEEVVDDALCVSCRTEGEGRNLVGLLESLCVAYYSLVEITQIRKDQLILVNSDDSVLYSIVNRIASQFGAKTITPVLQNERKVIAVDSDWPDDRHSSLQTGISRTMYSSRLAVLIDTLGDIRLSSISHHLAPNCKLVRVGSATKFPDFSPADLTSLKKSISINYFDVIDLAESEPSFVEEILAKSVELARDTDLTSVLPSLTTYSIADLTQAIQAITSSRGSSRIGLACQPSTMVPVHHIQNSSFEFRPDGAYLLIGCLGGLGRSITGWMLERGARHFVFLSRSGADKLEAQTLVRKLRNHEGVTVQLVKGDVTIREDVQRVVTSAKLPVRGVIQAASAFDECYFKAMDLRRFSKVTGPKVNGTIYLHEETLGQPLDFFVVTSSSIGITGATTQSHYAAGNAFLDSFAHYRRSLGLPACSLSLGMVTEVGHVHDEGLEDILRKRGGYGISEDEFLRMMELACSGGTSHQSQEPTGKHLYDPSLIVTGLDPTKLVDQTTATQRANDDPILSHIVHAVKRLAPEMDSNTTPDGQQSPLVLLRSLLQDPKGNEEQVNQTLQLCIIQKLSSLVLIPVSELEDSLHRPLSDLGLDSIVSADFQAWARRELKVTIDFMEMLAGSQTIGSLNGIIRARLA